MGRVRSPRPTTRGTSARRPTFIVAAGFGATRAELQRDVAAGPAESVGRLLKSREPSDEEKAVCDGLRAGAVGSSDPRRLCAYWLYRMLFGGDPLRERLTLFWHGHFATSLTKVDSVTALAAQVDTLRERSLGGFAGLLDAMIADPAMLVWLDGGTSRRERPNENFAREFLELFTLGQGAYSERDIREAARAFTGWVSERGARMPSDSNPKFVFDNEAHDSALKTFLGQTGPWTGRRHRADHAPPPRGRAAPGAKLYRAFVAEEPEPAPRADRAPGRRPAVKRLFDRVA